MNSALCLSILLQLASYQISFPLSNHHQPFAQCRRLCPRPLPLLLNDNKETISSSSPLFLQRLRTDFYAYVHQRRPNLPLHGQEQEGVVKYEYSPTLHSSSSSLLLLLSMLLLMALLVSLAFKLRSLIARRLKRVYHGALTSFFPVLPQPLPTSPVKSSSSLVLTVSPSAKENYIGVTAPGRCYLFVINSCLYILQSYIL